MSVWSWARDLLHTATAGLLGMVWPTNSTRSSRNASTQRGKLGQGGRDPSPGKHKAHALSSSGKKAAAPPPLVPSVADDLDKSAVLTAKKLQSKPQPSSTVSTLPALLTNPINVNYDGKHMDLEERRVRVLVEGLPETLKSIKRMCVGLSLLARSNPPHGPPNASSSAEKADAMKGRPAILAHVPAPSSSPGAVIATKRGSAASLSLHACVAPTSTTTTATATAAAAAAAAEAAEVDKIVEALRVLQALLLPLPALQTARPFAMLVTSKAALAKYRRRRSGKPEGAPGSESSDDFLSYYHTVLRNVAPSRRRMAWQAFLHKSSNAFSLLIGSLKTEAVRETPSLCAELMTLLYNVLRNIPETKTESSAEKEKKAVKYCEKLNLVKVLSVITQRYHDELQRVERRASAADESTDATLAAVKLQNEITVDRFLCVRILETAALLYAEVARVDVKVTTMMRLSKDMRRILDAAQYVALACVLRTLQAHTKLSDFGCQPVAQVVKAVGSGGGKGAKQAALKAALSTNRRAALKGLESVSRSTSFYLGTLAHLLMVLFMSARTGLAAQELGLKGVALAVRVVGVLAEFLYTTLPKVRRVLTPSLAKLGGGVDDGGGGGDASGGTVFREPAWVQLYKRRLEMALFWAIALMERVCEKDKKTNFTGELHDRNHIMASLFLILKSTGREGSQTLDSVEPAEMSMSSDADHVTAGTGFVSRRRSGSTRSLYDGSFAGGAYELDSCRPSQSGSAGPAESEQGDYMDENEEMTLAVMTTMNVVLRANRAKALEELSSVCGGLAGVVREVLKFRSEAPEQWHRYLTMMTAMYGVRLLPSRAGESAYDLDARLPAYMFAEPEDDGAKKAGTDTKLPGAATTDGNPLRRGLATAASSSSLGQANKSSSRGTRGGGAAPSLRRSSTTNDANLAAMEGPLHRCPPEDEEDARLASTTGDVRKDEERAGSSGSRSSSQRFSLRGKSRSPGGGSLRLGAAAASFGDASRSPSTSLMNAVAIPDSTRARTPSLPSRGPSPALRDDDDDAEVVAAEDAAPNVSFGENAAAVPSCAADASQCAGRVSPSVAGAAAAAAAEAVSSRRRRSELLLVDRRPEAFSPELRLGEPLSTEEAPALDPESLLCLDDACADFTFPWPFDAPGPPATNLMTEQHRNEAGPALPLQPPTREQRIAILKHHISRLRALSEAATDFSPDPTKRHRYEVVYEREDGISRLRRPPGQHGGSGDSGAAGVAPGPMTPSASQEALVAPTLTFASNFESGNLKRAVRISPHEYDLIMNWDTSTNGFTQWFCFSVSDYEPGATYRFNIINMEKKGSCFNDGQRPLMLLVPSNSNSSNGAGGDDGSSAPARLLSNGPDWQRTGHDVLYFMNAYGRADRASMHGKPFPIPSAPGTASGGEGQEPRSRARCSRSGGNALSQRQRVSPTPAPPADGSSATPTTGKSQDSVRRNRKLQEAVPSQPSPARTRELSLSSRSRLTPTAGSGRTSPQSAAIGPGIGSSRVSPSPAALQQPQPPQKAASGKTATTAASTRAAQAAAPPDFATDFFTLSFTVTMPMRRGRVYFANCFPYTYTELRAHLRAFQRPYNGAATPGSPEDPTGRYLAMQSLCRTLGGLPVPIVTVTARRRPNGGAAYTAEEIRARPVCVISARIHPGETNSSWMMHGVLEALLRSHVGGAAGGIAAKHRSAANDAVQHLLRTFVFKLVPMLNPDGVVMGNHRCSLAGVDLNRDYLKPDAEVNPTIYAVHRYVQHMIDREGRTVALFVDFHGHSVARNFLLYGCTQTLAEGLARRLAKDKETDGSPRASELGEGGIGGSRSPAPSPTGDVDDLSVVGGVGGGGGGDGDEGGDAAAAAIGCEKLFPILLAHTTPSFGLSQCSFSMQKAMRKTGRIVQYRKYGIRMSYTIEGTMAGGSGADYVCSWLPPTTLQTNKSCGKCDSTPDTNAADTHYTQDAYSALGHSFLSTLHLFVALDDMTRQLTTGGLSGDPRGSSCCRSDRLPMDLVALAWEQLTHSGAGKAAPVPPTAVSYQPQPLVTCDEPATVSERGSILRSCVEAVGSYVLATRSARRTGLTPPSSQHATPLTNSPLQPSYTMVPDSEWNGIADADIKPDETLVNLASGYQTAMRFLMSTAATRIADEGDNEEESGGDNDSDDGPRVTPISRRRATPTGGAGGKKKKSAAAAAKRRTPQRTTAAGGGGGVEARDSVSGKSAATGDGAAPPRRSPTTRQPPLSSPVATIEDDDDDDDVTQPETMDTARERTDVDTTTDGAPSPREDLDVGDAELGDDLSVSDDGADVISLSDDEIVEDDDGLDDAEDEAAALERTRRTEVPLGDSEGDDDDGENTFVDNGSDFDCETDLDDADWDDADADYGELEPMPSNVFT